MRLPNVKDKIETCTCPPPTTKSRRLKQKKSEEAPRATLQAETGIPNSIPYKDQLLVEIEQERVKKDEERLWRSEEVK